jgi:hypothetical protein
VTGGVVTGRGAGRAAGRFPSLLPGILLLAALVAIGPGLRLAGLVGASDWGSDWRWLEDGLTRLGQGLPLTDPRLTAGPWSQFGPGPAYTWSLQAPYLAAFLSPMLLLPADPRSGAWLALTAAALGAGFAIAWPRTRDARVHVLLATLLVGPPIVGLGVALVDQLHYANPNAFVVLGVALAWRGRERGSAALIAAGLVLAALKIVPALALLAWLAPGLPSQPRVRRGIAAAAVVLVALTVPVLVLDPRAIGDMLASQLNLQPVMDATNLSPRVWLAPLLGLPAAAALTVVAGLAGLGTVLIRRLDGAGGLVLATAACCLLTPQLWTHWLLIPGVAAVIAFGGRWIPDAMCAMDARRTVRDAIIAA